jgi:hypothetical protein
MPVEHVQELLSARTPVELPEPRWRWPCTSLPEVSLSRPGFISSPFLRRNKAHARAVTFVVPRGLAGIFECCVVAGSVPARTEFSCKLRRTSGWAAASTDHWFCVLYVLAGHSSSLFVYPRRRSRVPGVSFLLVSHPHWRISKRPSPEGGSDFRGHCLRGMSLLISVRLYSCNYKPDQSTFT